MDKVFGLPKRPFPVQQRGGAYRLDHLPCQPFGRVARPPAGAVLNVEVEPLVVELVAPDAGHQPHLALRVTVEKALKPGCDPVDRIAHRRADGQNLGPPEAKYLFGARRQTFEPVADLWQIGGADLGQHQAPGFALEQGFTQVMLQQLDLFADRGLGQVQFLRGMGETQMPGGCFEGTQPCQMGKSPGAHDQLMHNSDSVIGRLSIA